VHPTSASPLRGDSGGKNPLRGAERIRLPIPPWCNLVGQPLSVQAAGVLVILPRREQILGRRAPGRVPTPLAGRPDVRARPIRKWGYGCDSDAGARATVSRADTSPSAG